MNRFVWKTAYLIVTMGVLLPNSSHTQTAAQSPPAGEVRPPSADKSRPAPTLRDLLNSANPKRRAKGIQKVVRNRVTNALPKLEKMAKNDPVPGIRRLACWAIGELELKGGMLTLRTVARRDEAERVREAARRAMARIEGKPVTVAETPEPAQTTKEKESTGGQCQKDTDCKGERICNQGICKNLEKFPTTGWALEASVIGFVGSAAMFGLTIYAALHPEDLLPAIPLAAGATLVTVIVAPSVKSGSRSVRDNSDIPGSLTLRVLGWVCFGIHIGGSAALAVAIPFHWLKKDNEGANWTPQSSWIWANGAVGMASLLLLSIEALVARQQAVKRIEELDQQKRRGDTTLRASLSPFIAPALGTNGTAGAIAGLGGNF